jgi:hypothetical protein
LFDLKKEDVVAATNMGIGYNDSKPILGISFFKYERKMKLYLLPVNKSNEALMDQIRNSDKKTYIDVR